MPKIKFISEQTLKSKPSTTIDGKKVYFLSKRNIPPKKVIKKVYRMIPDDKKVPIVFETKKQYLKEYIKNQEQKHNIDFPSWQEQQYINKEMVEMKPIVSRFTTYHNKYIEPRVVFFTDYKQTPQTFKQNALHEYGHEKFEKEKLHNKWNFSPKTSPTQYGKSDKEEDFAETFALWKDKITRDKLIKSHNTNIQQRFKTLQQIQQDKYSNSKKIDELLPTFGAENTLPQVESSSYSKFVYPQENKVVYNEKPLYLLGKIKDLFKEGNHLKIINRRGEVVRELTKTGDRVIIDPKGGAEIIELSDDEDLFYEPWFMDVGSILFRAPKELPGLGGHMLKLGVESDDVDVVKDIESKEKKYYAKYVPYTQKIVNKFI